MTTRSLSCFKCFSTSSTSVPRVFVSHRLLPPSLSLLSSVPLQIIQNDNVHPLPRHELLSQVSQADGMIAFMTDSVDKELLDLSPRLRIVAGAMKGVDNFDITAMTEKGVYFTRCEDLLTAPTAELAIGLALALSRRIFEGDERIRSGHFSGWRADLYGKSLAGSIVGCVGLGAVGRSVATTCKVLGAKQVLYIDPSESSMNWASTHGVERVTKIEELMKQCDFVFPLTPLTKETRHLIGRATLDSAKSGLLLINVGRGGCVDEEAVANALADGRLGGYAADVFELEDWAVTDRRRDIPNALLVDKKKCVFTPHVGSAVEAVRSKIEVEAVENIIDLLVRKRRPRSAVNQVKDNFL